MNRPTCTGCRSTSDVRSLPNPILQSANRWPCICRACYGDLDREVPFENLPDPNLIRAVNLQPVSNVDVAEVAVQFLTADEKVALMSRLADDIQSSLSKPACRTRSQFVALAWRMIDMAVGVPDNRKSPIGGDIFHSIRNANNNEARHDS